MSIVSWITVISTVAVSIATIFMAIFAGVALNVWKNEQKRLKLINLLEGLNKYIQELQLYELESILYSKQSKYQKIDLSNLEFLNNEIRLIDCETAQEYGNCILLLKNWLIDHDEHKQILNEINQKMQAYRESIYELNIMKKDFVIKKSDTANIMYDKIKITMSFDKVKEFQKLAMNDRNDLEKIIDKFKELNKKLLK